MSPDEHDAVLQTLWYARWCLVGVVTGVLLGIVLAFRLSAHLREAKALLLLTKEYSSLAKRSKDQTVVALTEATEAVKASIAAPSPSPVPSPEVVS